MPDHQCGDVAKGTERTAGVGADHDVDTGDRHELRLTRTDGQNHRTHNQRGCQVIRDRRDEEGQNTRQPEQCPVAKAFFDQPFTQRVENAALQHGVDVGHRYQEEEEQFSVFEEVVTNGFLDRVRHVVTAVSNRDQDPDQACCQ